MRLSIVYILASFISSSGAVTKFPHYLETRDTSTWRNITCDTGVLTDALKPGSQQWNDSHAEDAWKEAVAQWKKDKPTNAAFPTWLANWFHAPPGFACEKIATGECQTPLECGQGGAEGSINSPAGYVIYNSMRMLHGKFESYYWGLYNAHQMMDGDIDLFDMAFSPVIDPMKDEKIVLDILGMVLACVNAGVFNVFLRKFATLAANGNALSQSKDMIGAIIAGSLQISRDSMSAINVLTKIAEMKKYLKDTVSAMIDNWVATVNKIFTDPDQIYTFIQGGSMWDPGNVTSPEDVMPQLEHILYAYLVPHAWATSNALKGPMFIATSEGQATVEGRTGCTVHDPGRTSWDVYGGWTNALYFYKNVLGESLFCDGDDAYWLVSLAKLDDPDLQAAYVYNVPGWDKFADDEWGGISRQELALNAVHAWKANNKWNGWDSPSEDEIVQLDEIKQLPRGLIKIPVCSWMEAAHNIKEWDDRKGMPEDNPNFPCNAQPSGKWVPLLCQLGFCS